MIRVRAASSPAASACQPPGPSKSTPFPSGPAARGTLPRVAGRPVRGVTCHGAGSPLPAFGPRSRARPGVQFWPGTGGSVRGARDDSCRDRPRSSRCGGLRTGSATAPVTGWKCCPGRTTIERPPASKRTPGGAAPAGSVRSASRSPYATRLPSIQAKTDRPDRTTTPSTCTHWAGCGGGSDRTGRSFGTRSASSAASRTARAVSIPRAFRGGREQPAESPRRRLGEVVPRSRQAVTGGVLGLSRGGRRPAGFHLGEDDGLPSEPARGADGARRWLLGARLARSCQPAARYSEKAMRLPFECAEEYRQVAFMPHLELDRHVGPPAP